MSVIFKMFPGWAIPPAAYSVYAEKLGDMHICDFGFFNPAISFDFLKMPQIPEGPNILMAHSMGTMFALRAAAENAGNIKALVLFAPFARFVADEFYAAQSPAKPRAMLRQLARDPQKLLADFYRSAAPALDVLHGNLMLNHEALKKGLEFIASADYREMLKNIKVPVLIIQGLSDIINMPETADFVARSIPHAKYLRYEGRGHATVFEDAHEYIPLIKQFIKENNLN